MNQNETPSGPLTGRDRAAGEGFNIFSPSTVPRDLTSGVVVALVALPLCLGIAMASGAPLLSGLVAGIVGGILIGSLSGSHTSVSGPAAGLTAIVAVQISTLGFETFLLAVMISGLIQIGLGLVRAGALSAFFPSSVIKGLLAAIGVILILKQIPHLLGHDTDPEGEMSFVQPDDENTFSEFGRLLAGEIHPGAIVVGLVCIGLLVAWGRVKFLKESIVPGPLVVVLLGVVLNMAFARVGGSWLISGGHLVNLPPDESLLTLPNFLAWNDSGVYRAAVTIAVVASLETLLNLEAVDKLDRYQRSSPPSRELIAQGIGNTVCGLVGGLPVTSVVVRGSVNVASGSRTKLSAVFHGVLLLVAVLFLPEYINRIPKSALAAILLVTGFKLASPALFRQMWKQGRYQFIPFVVTLLAIVFTDLMVGILIGLTVSAMFILNSNLRYPIRRIVETHLGGDVLHIELAQQVSFLNRAALAEIFKGAAKGSSVLIDARDTDYIDPDVLSLIQDYRENQGAARGIKVSLRGFREKYQMLDDIQFADYTTRELQDQVTPQQVLEILQEGNRRFRTGHRLSRDFERQVSATAQGQTPLAVILGCIDSRVPTELVFDLGLGDIFSVRVAGNVIGTKSLASIEYGVGVAGVKLVLVMGHTKCGAVTSSVNLVAEGRDAEQATGCDHLQAIVDEIAQSVARDAAQRMRQLSDTEKEAFVDEVARKNVLRTVDEITDRSHVIRKAVEAGTLIVAAAMYDVRTGQIEFLRDVVSPPPAVAAGNPAGP